MSSRMIRLVSILAAVFAGAPLAAAQTLTPPTDTVVVSNGEFVLHERDLDTWWQAHDSGSFAKVRQELYDGRRKALEGLLGDYLLGHEAASRKVSVEKLLEEELPKLAAAVTDVEVRTIYEQSLPLPGGMTFDQLKPMVMTYLQQQHLDDARARFVEQLRESAHLVTHLDPPRQLVGWADGDPAMGPSTAPIRIVEFADFECPFCRQLEPVLKQLRTKYADRVQLVWKDFPLAIHDGARAAAEAARCAADQGRFWEYHDLLFANQQALGADDLARHARAAGLDEARFTACLEGGAHRTEIAANLEEGTRQGVAATPTVFINGRAIVGAQGLDTFDKVILEELTR